MCERHTKRERARKFIDCQKKVKSKNKIFGASAQYRSFAQVHNSYTINTKQTYIGKKVPKNWNKEQENRRKMSVSCVDVDTLYNLSIGL